MANKFTVHSSLFRVMVPRLKFLFLFLLAVTIGYRLLTIDYLYAQDKIIAVVNNDVITQRDLDEFVNFMRMQMASELSGRELETKIHEMKMDLLNKLIEDKLILQEAKKDNIQVDPGRINDKVSQIKKRYTSEEEFQKAILEQGLSQSDIEAKIREQVLMYSIIERKIKNKITVKPGEVTLFYEQNKQEISYSEQRDFNYLVIDDPRLADSVFMRLKNNPDMGEAAKAAGITVSQINIVRQGQLKKEIEEKIAKLNPGELSGIIKNEGRYYIFKLNAIIPARQQSLQEAQDNVYNFLFEDKMQKKLAAWLDDLKGRAYIKIMP